MMKSLYGLKQAKKLYNKMIIKFYQKIRFIPNKVDLCIPAWKQSNIFILIIININDFLLESQSRNRLE